MGHEIWKPVESSGNLYEVSNMGRVRSVKRYAANRWYGGKILKASLCYGYPRVCFSVQNKQTYELVHQLVLRAFIGPRPPGQQACHNNGNRLDNRASNLRWDTTKNNHADKKMHGTHVFGEKHPMRKLDEHKVKQIKISLAAGKSCRVIAVIYGVARETINNIKRGTAWAHVQ